VSRFRNFSIQAAAELDDAVGWLLDHGVAPASAEQLLSTVLSAAERLAERPALGRRRPELLPEPFRFWSIPRWKLLLSPPAVLPHAPGHATHPKSARWGAVPLLPVPEPR
jgi:plasmid stabilization system protein ParE